jgi:methyltransferase
MPEERVLAVAIPDSSFLDEDNLRGKTLKIGQIARSCSIFGVNRIYIYRDGRGNNERDYQTAREILQYAETPQYLRKRLIAKKSDLDFVGLLPPLRIPHHKLAAKLELGDVREAVLVYHNGELMADVGARQLANYTGKGQANQRVTVKIESAEPNLKAAQSDPPEGRFWGYEVRRAPSFGRFLKSLSFDLVILTSRLGKQVTTVWDQFTKRLLSSERTIVCFGAPDAGIDVMLSQDRMNIRDFSGAEYLNTFPDQQVATVRLEEAMLGTLAILNVARKLKPA